MDVVELPPADPEGPLREGDGLELLPGREFPQQVVAVGQHHAAVAEQGALLQGGRLLLHAGQCPSISEGKLLRRGG